MIRPDGPPRRAPSPGFLPILALGLVCACLLFAPSLLARTRSASAGDAALNAQTAFIDYLYPEAFQASTLINLPLAGNRVQLTNLRILTANRQWSLQICGSVSDPTSCVNPLASWDPKGTGWRGDFRVPSWSMSYQDLDAGKQLHLRVTPMSGDWMIFRIQLQVTTTP
jgi:hypothetical protein